LLGSALSAQVDSEQQVRTDAQLLQLRYAQFDPRNDSLTIPAALTSDARQNLWIVQFLTTPSQSNRDDIAVCQGKIVGYLPNNAYVVRGDATKHDAPKQLATIAGVRSVSAYHPAFRI